MLSNYPEIVWPKTPQALPGETPPDALKTLQTGGEPQNPVAGVPPQLVPQESITDPGVPDVPVDASGQPTQPPDTTTSVTADAVKKEGAGWMRNQLEQFTKVGEIGTSFKKGILSSIPTAIAGINSDIQQTRIANTVGLGEIDAQNFKALAPLLRIALENPDEKARQASKERILASVPTLQGLPHNLRGTSEAFIESAFSDPKFLDSMSERSKYKYSPFTDPVIGMVLEQQSNIDKRNPQDAAFVNSWADKIASAGGSIASFLAARKAGGRVGLDAFAVYSGQGQLYQDALSAGASPEIAFKAASLGGLVGVTDVLPIERLVASPKVTRALFALAISAGKQAVYEGFQEGFQQYMSNAIAKVLYRPDQDMSQQVWESVAIGAIGGIGADLATGGFREELKRPTPKEGNFTGPSSTAIPPAPGAPSVIDITAKPGSYDPATWGKRPDGTDKGNGFLGVLQRPDGGVSSEISVGVQIGGKETDVPLLVPTLTRPELDAILAIPDGDPKFFDKLPPGVIDKARAFAEQRLAAGKGVFADASESPAQTNSPGAAPMAPATGEAAKPASPTLPEPMKVGLISKLPPAQRAIEADYVMAHDFSLVEPIQAEVAKGTPLSEISKVLEPQMGQVDAYLAKKGVTAPADIFLERDAIVRSVVAKLGIANQTSASMAPSEALPTTSPFPNTKIVDASGAPMVVYHGTNQDFQTFRAGGETPIGSTSYSSGEGIYFTSDPKLASGYASKNFADKSDIYAGANVRPVHLDIRNPLVIKSSSFWQKLRAKVQGTERQLKSGVTRQSAYYTKAEVDALKAQGYDGVINDTASEIVAFSPDQIRSKFDTAPPAPLGVNDGQAGQASQTSDTGGEPTGRGSGAQAPLGEGERLPGLPPGSPGPNQGIVDAAKAYLDARGLPYRRQAFHVYADPERGKRIADAYEAMPHAPNDPEVKAAYAALIEETKAQYQAVLDTGLQIEMIQPGQANPYSEGPKQVFDDLAKNHLWFYPSASGFGTVNEITDNPLLTPTEFKVGDHVMLANDLFRVVHDVFGHGLEGAGFGPSGEENAFQAHVRMFSPLAARAMTSETRGQNSWVNFGPFGEANRANQKETVYADQKTGLMPEWTTTDGIVPDVPPIQFVTKRLPDLFHAQNEPHGDVSDASLPPKSVRHAYIHERVRPQQGIVHTSSVSGQPVEEIAKKFKDALGLTVQVGRFDRGKGKAQGIFKWAQSVIRVRTESDLTTLFHEGGHQLHQEMGKELDTLIDKHYAEMEHIATHYYGGGGVIDATDKTLVRREGFAHFFQAYMNNPLAAANIAPGFMPEFEALLDKQQPGLRAALNDVVKQVDTHLTKKSSKQVALEHVSPGKKPGQIARIVEAAKGGNLMHEIGTLIQRTYMDIVGGEYALQHTINELARTAEDNYRVLLERGEMSKADVETALNALNRVGKKNPVKLYWMAKNAANRSAEFLHSGVQKFNTRDYAAVSKGMTEILANVTGGLRGHLRDEAVHSFDAYLMARRIRSERQNYKLTMDWLRSGKQGTAPVIQRMQDPDPSFPEGDTSQAIVDFEKEFPQFKQAAEDVYGFLRAMVQYRYDAGDYTKEEYDYFMAFVDFVPLHRVIEETKRVSGMGQQIDGKTNGIKMFKGSSRQVVSPLRSIWQMTHQQIAMSMANEMRRATVDMALDIGQGTGALIEKIPDSAMKGTTVNLSEILKAAGHVDVTAAGLQVQGMDMKNLSELADELMSGDEVATIWRPGELNEKGEHIIYVWRNGKREAYKLNDPVWADDLYRTLVDLAPPQRTMLIHILSAPARALRWGVVTEPVYQLANTIRDAFQGMVMNPPEAGDAWSFLPPIARGLKNHLYRAQMQKIYNHASSTIAGRDIAGLDKHKFGIEQGFLASKGITLKDVPGVSGISEIVKTFYSSESLGRQGIFARAYERAIKDGLSEADAEAEASFASTDYANYGRGGSRMAEARAIIPFLGAGIQALDKFGRAAFAGSAIGATIRKQVAPWMNRTLNLQGTKTSLPLTKAEGEAFKTAAKIQAAMVVMSLASMLLDSMYWGDEEYEQFSPYMRGTRWLYKIGPGQWLGIPKPFQYAMYSTFASYALEAVYKGDTTAMMKFLESQLYVTSLPYENPGIALGYELAFNKDLFTGRDIVPQNVAARPWRMQSDIYTSVLGKKLGQITGLSPMIIDHVITSSFATWGRSAMALSNLTDSSRPQQGLEDWAFTHYFIKNGSRSTTVKPAFWNLVGQSTGSLIGAYGAFRDLMDGGAAGQAQAYLAGATDDERAYANLNYYQKADAKKLHPLRNAQDMVSALSAMRKEITANNFKLDGGDGDRHVMSPTIQRMLNDRISALAIREMRNALVVTDQPGFKGKKVLDTLSIYREIEAIDGAVARELKNRMGSKVYSFDVVRRLWPSVRTEILLNGEKANLTPFVSQAKSAGKKYFTEGDPL